MLKRSGRSTPPGACSTRCRTNVVSQCNRSSHPTASVDRVMQVPEPCRCDCAQRMVELFSTPPHSLLVRAAKSGSTHTPPPWWRHSSSTLSMRMGVVVETSGETRTAGHDVYLCSFSRRNLKIYIRQLFADALHADRVYAPTSWPLPCRHTVLPAPRAWPLQRLHLYRPF